jgi:hypothetical protein
VEWWNDGATGRNLCQKCADGESEQVHGVSPVAKWITEVWKDARGVYLVHLPAHLHTPLDTRRVEAGYQGNKSFRDDCYCGMIPGVYVP